MRLAGSVAAREHAQRFVDHLRSIGVEASFDRGQPDDCQIWIEDERELDRAVAELSAFALDPEAPRYLDSAEEGRRQREANAAKMAAESTSAARARRRHEGDRLLGPFPVTYALVALSIAVALASNLGSEHDSIRRYLHIVDWTIDGDYISFNPEFLYDVRHGQVWRLLTPIFIHFGPLHLLFNLMWLLDFGGQIERHRGTPRLAALTLLIAIPSNVAELVISGPQFGGLSGVVYGLFGYILTRSHYDPSTPMSLRPSTVYWLLAWFVICLTGILPVANGVHAAGLAIGCAVGGRHELARRVTG